MPEPLAIPVIVTVMSLSVICLDTALATMSVVMMACAASSQLSSRSPAAHAGNPEIKRDNGNASIITPVENGSTCSALQLNMFATSAQVARAATNPGSPVPALAFPVLTTSARTPSPAARCSRATITGAAQKRLCVKTPATVVWGAKCTSSKSLRPGFLMPASAVPISTPLTGSRALATGACRLTGIAIPCIS